MAHDTLWDAEPVRFRLRQAHVAIVLSIALGAHEAGNAGWASR